MTATIATDPRYFLTVSLCGCRYQSLRKGKTARVIKEIQRDEARRPCGSKDCPNPGYPCPVCSVRYPEGSRWIAWPDARGRTQATCPACATAAGWSDGEVVPQ